MQLQALAAALAAFALAGPSFAEPVREAGDGSSLTTKVTYGDINLHTTQGARELLSRVHIAAGKVCHAGWPSSRVQLTTVQTEKACISAAESRAVANLGSPVVTAVYRDLAITDLLAAR